MIHRQFTWVAAGAMLAATFAFGQKTAADIPVETFFKRAQYTNMQLAPDGKRLAATIPTGGRDNLVVIDLEKRTRKMITSFTDFDVALIRWINNDRLCLRVADRQDATGQYNFVGTYCVDHDGENARNFSSSGFSASAILALTHDKTPDVLVYMWQRSKSSADVYRFNTITGTSKLLTYDTPGFVVRWVLDHDNVPRVAVSQPRQERDGRTRELWYRDSASSKWEVMGTKEMVAGSISVGGVRYEPIAFDDDNKTLLVTSAERRDKSAIYRFDPKAKKLGDLVFEHPLIDVGGGGLVWSETLRKHIGIRFDAERPGVKWLDAQIEKVQNTVDASLPKTINEIYFPSETDDRALVVSSSDVQPPIYFLLDRKKPSLEMLAQTREWIDPDLMAERRFIQYKARDGLVVPAWLTLPKGSEGKKVPLIVHVHGGPNIRGYSFISWGRWPTAQFLASRGYAVLEPEPRGSTGFGSRHLTLGLKQWGQKMQDDLTDGALYLAKMGIVDEKRMCLHGASYGGYAAAMGLAKDPDVWRCGSPYVAVTDLFMLQNLTSSDASRFSDFLQGSFKRVVGDSEADKEMFTKYSPALQAHRIRAPVFLAVGSADTSVPIQHGIALRDAIERAGGQIEYVVYNNEAHGFNKDENVFDFYKRLEKFFERNLKQ